MITSLADLLPAVGANFAVPSNQIWPYSKVSKVVVLLVDGLGLHNILQTVDLSDYDLDSVKSIESAIPSTTPVSLTTLGTGLSSGGHGIVGATLWLPEEEQILRPLHWEQSPLPQSIQPEPTWFEKIARTTNVVRLGPAKYAESGLTQAALRGGTHVGAETLSDLQFQIVEQATRMDSGFVYAYYPDLDKIGHVNGVASLEWQAELRNVLSTIREVANSLPSSTQFLVTADHGMVDVKNRIWIEQQPTLMNDVLRVTGEPRFRHVFAKPGKAGRLHERWLTLSDYADIYTREEAIEFGIFGLLDEFFIERIGDVVAVAKSGYILAAETVDRRVSELIGHHGGYSDIEKTVPLIEIAS